MENAVYSTSIFFGKSRRKVENITLTLKDIQEHDDESWTYHVICTGAISEDKVLQANSPFACIILGMAFLRQALRRFKADQSKIKFYEDTECGLEEITIEDVFWTHDCITEEIEEKIRWAEENGYKGSAETVP